MMKYLWILLLLCIFSDFFSSSSLELLNSSFNEQILSNQSHFFVPFFSGNTSTSRGLIFSPCPAHFLFLTSNSSLEHLNSSFNEQILSNHIFLFQSRESVGSWNKKLIDIFFFSDRNFLYCSFLQTSILYLLNVKYTLCYLYCFDILYKSRLIICWAEEMGDFKDSS